MPRTRELPPPLPHAERTIGQLVAESIRLYGDRFWRVLPLGLPLAILDQLAQLDVLPATLWFLLFGPLITAAYLWAVTLVTGARPTWTAYLVGLLVYAPFPALRLIYVLPALAWFALLGLAVPAAMVERLPFRAALIRGRELAVADYVHALGSLCALAVVLGLSELTLVLLLRTQGEAGQHVAAFLADLVLSPLLFVGGALLYLDQKARVGRRHSRRPAVE